MAEIIKGSGITQAKLENWYNLARSEYSKAHQRAKRLDALDRNKLWEMLRSKFPAYQLLPQTNHVSYVKQNIVASIYSVGKSATLMCTCEQDRDTIENLNIALDHIWSTRNVAMYQLQAGERAALLNLGITQVGWDNSIITGTADSEAFEKGQVKLKNIDPLKYYRDPYADSLDTASFVVTWEDFHESFIESNPKYAQEFKKYKAQSKGGTGSDITRLLDKSSPSSAGKPGYHRIYTWFVKHGKDIAEIHMLDNKHCLYSIDAIKPAIYPFAELYCNLPQGDLIGTSEPAKVMDNSIVYNLMQSILYTSAYKNQRPPRFVSDASGLNINSFAKYGNDADKTFVVRGDASKAVHYQSFPEPSPVTMQAMGSTTADIQTISGVDGKYTGRDTGSVITTGGVNSMLDQATMIDAPRILLYEDYAKRLTKLIIYNYINNSATDRKYLVKDNTKANAWNTVTVQFPKIDANIVFDYQINISSEMPKNKARLAATADAMMEKQMQYQGAGIDCDLITPEEWLMMQDIPNKEYFQERMGIQKTQNWQSLVAQAVTQYAAMVDQGIAPADAINATAQTMAQEQQVGQQANMEEIATNTQLF